MAESESTSEWAFASERSTHPRHGTFDVVEVDAGMIEAAGNGRTGHDVTAYIMLNSVRRVTKPGTDQESSAPAFRDIAQIRKAPASLTNWLASMVARVNGMDFVAAAKKSEPATPSA